MSKTKKVKYLSVPSDVHIETKQLDHVFLKYGKYQVREDSKYWFILETTTGIHK